MKVTGVGVHRPILQAERVRDLPLGEPCLAQNENLGLSGAQSFHGFPRALTLNTVHPSTQGCLKPPVTMTKGLLARCHVALAAPSAG